MGIQDLALLMLPLRVRSKVDPHPLESPRGYLCRLAQRFCYGDAGWILDLAGYRKADDWEYRSKTERLATVLRLPGDLWRSKVYLRVNTGNRFLQRQFFGHLIAADRLNYGAPRICPGCLQEDSIWWGIWDLSIVSACAGHRCELATHCPKCNEALRWKRPGVDRCHCEADLRETPIVEADTGLVAINAVVYQAAGFPIGLGRFDLGQANFPQELSSLGLDALIGLIVALGSSKATSHRTPKLAITEIDGSMSVAKRASSMLKSWPLGFHAELCRVLPSTPEDPGVASLSATFGDFYRFLLEVRKSSEFAFLTDSFQEFVVRHWSGLVRGQQRSLPQQAREQTRWLTALKAAAPAGLTPQQIITLVRTGVIAGIFVTPPKSRGRVECWLDRDSLNRWVSARDRDFERFMGIAEATRLLGLTVMTLRKIADADLMEIAKGPERGFPPGIHVCREGVERMIAAFAFQAPTAAEDYDGRSALLRDALRLYLGRDRLADFVRTVIVGASQPLGRDDSVPGILGYRFSIEDLKRYSKPKETRNIPVGMVTLSGAAKMLGINTEAVRNLVAVNQLRSDRKLAHGLRLLYLRDVRRFAEHYVAVQSLTARFGVGSRQIR
jgi:hypothetical protein